MFKSLRGSQLRAGQAFHRVRDTGSSLIVWPPVASIVKGISQYKVDAGELVLNLCSKQRKGERMSLEGYFWKGTYITFFMSHNHDSLQGRHGAAIFTGGISMPPEM